MLRSGEDTILENNIEPIPSNVIDFTEFEKRYDDIFLGLITTSGSRSEKQTFLK